MKTAKIFKITETEKGVYKMLIFEPVRDEAGVLIFPESKPIFGEFVVSLDIKVGDVVAL